MSLFNESRNECKDSLLIQRLVQKSFYRNSKFHLQFVRTNFFLARCCPGRYLREKCDDRFSPVSGSYLGVLISCVHPRTRVRRSSSTSKMFLRYSGYNKNILEF